MAGSGAGIWMHLQLAGTRYRRLVLFGPFPSVIFGSQEKDVHAAMHDARPKSETETSLWNLR